MHRAQIEKEFELGNSNRTKREKEAAEKRSSIIIIISHQWISFFGWIFTRPLHFPINNLTYLYISLRKQKQSKREANLQRLQKRNELLQKKREKLVEEEKQDRKKKAGKYIIPIDDSCYDKVGWKVYVDGENIFDCMLNQTDIQYVYNNDRYAYLRSYSSMFRKQYI